MSSTLATRRVAQRRSGNTKDDDFRSRLKDSDPPTQYNGKEETSLFDFHRHSISSPRFLKKTRNFTLLAVSMILVAIRWYRFQCERHHNYQQQRRSLGVFPRVVQYERQKLQIFRMLRSNHKKRSRELLYPLTENVKEPWKEWDSDRARSEPFETEECKAMGAWQLATYPSCNLVHEVDLSGSNHLDPMLLANGYWRDVWKIQEVAEQSTFVMKTQRYQHEFTERNLDRNRRDALISEHFTSSPYISNVFGFCGNSCLSEYADGGDMTHAIWSGNITKSEELVLAIQAAMALATLHGGNSGHAMVAHTDINPGQFIKVGDKYKLTDFNRARLLRWNVKKYRPCGYKVDRNPGTNRSPEEYKYELQSEKVDVYSLGNIFYMMLQKDWPFSDVKEKEAKSLVKEGFRPSFDAHVWNSSHPVDQALKEAMIQCHEQDPNDRATAKEIEKFLMDRLLGLDPSLIRNVTYSPKRQRPIFH